MQATGTASLQEGARVLKPGAPMCKVIGPPGYSRPVGPALVDGVQPASGRKSNTTELQIAWAISGAIRLWLQRAAASQIAPHSTEARITANEPQPTCERA